ncbi:MAG: DNA-processing protein DprA [Dehalococcoidia bacterium]
MENKRDLPYWVAFNSVPGIGSQRFRLLERRFGTLEAAWQASGDELKRAGLDEGTISTLLARRPTISPEGELERLERAGVQVLTWHDAGYPPRLKEIYDPPPVFYIKGRLLLEDERSVTLVGTRRATAYGREATAALAGDLARSGVTIVSGLARGIDAVAHRAALQSGGRTIAVLASGLDIIYPPEHRDLAQEIEARGALVSELPLGVRPQAQQFPRRNRIMSGMTLGVLVIEAGQVSGALWTVRHALEQNREVFCVPGSIFSPASRGTNALIQEGAKLVMSHTDVLEELNLTTVAHQMELRAVAPPENGNEALLLQHLSHEPLHIDEVRRRSGLPIAVVSSTLAMLELKGLARQVGAMHYIRAREVAADYAP